MTRSITSLSTATSFRARPRNRTVVGPPQQRTLSSRIVVGGYKREFMALRQPQQQRQQSTAVAATVVEDDSSSHSNHRSNPYYPKLFEPLSLGPSIGVLPNRVLMGSMHTGLEGHSMPSWMVPLVLGKWPWSKEVKEHGTHHSMDRMATYFATRAQGGVGLMVTGGIAPNREGWTGPFSGQLTNEREMEQHKVVTQAVHDVSVPLITTTTMKDDSTSVPARICLQILHAGRYAYHPWAVSASATKSPISPFKARAMTKRDIAATTQAFIRTAVLAKQAGYDGVEVMASEGYLLSQFLSPRTNLRTDEYGGAPLEHRARFPLEIVQGIRHAVGDDFIIIFRLSLLDLVDQGLSFEESVQLAQQVEQAGATILNTGIGWHEARIPTIHTSVPRAAFAFPTHALKQANVVKIPIVATNRINHPQTAEQLLTDDYSDMISMARPFLADPELMEKARTGRPEDINTCIGCNQACLDHVFVGQVASCLVNPMACHETEFQPNHIRSKSSIEQKEPSQQSPKQQKFPLLLPKEERLRIGVVGAGPAGCAFALAAAHQMGHDVVLFDKDTRIGGQFNMAKKIPGKEEFYETLRYFETQLHKQPSPSSSQQQNDTATTTTGLAAEPNGGSTNNPDDVLSVVVGSIDVRLNTAVTVQDMEQEDSIDVWIDATGVLPRNPNIPGQDHPNVLSYIDVLKHKKPVGRRVAIIGAGGIGFDVAEYLLHHHHPEQQQEQPHGDDTTTEDDDDTTNKAEQMDPVEFWKTWGIDTSLKSRGGLVPTTTTTTTTEDSSSSSSSSSNHNRRQLYLLQRKTSKLGKGLGKTTGWIHRATLNQSGAVEMIPGAQYKKIDEQGHLHIDITTSSSRKKKNKNSATTQQQRVLEVDTIVLCSGQIEHTTLRDEASPELRKRLYAIGGAYHAGELDAKRAIDMGTRLAVRLHTLGTVQNDDGDSSTDPTNKKKRMHNATDYQHPGPPPPSVEQAMFHLLKRFM